MANIGTYTNSIFKSWYSIFKFFQSLQSVLYKVYIYFQLYLGTEKFLQFLH